MSWSLSTKCYDCKKVVECVDINTISGAIDITHSLGYQKKHLGGGTIIMDCQNYVKNTE